MIISTKYIDELLDLSIIRDFRRGPRRYFPLPIGNSKGDNWLYLAYYVLYGSLPIDDYALVVAIDQQGLRDYIEEFDDQLWVRTVYLVDYPNPEKGHRLKLK